MFRCPSRQDLPVMAWLIGGLLAVQILLSGCEPVRKKFIRKKRSADVETAVQPVFEPEEYPAAELSPEDKYQGHFNRVLVWTKEAITNMEDKASDKRIVFSLKACLKELEGMEALLPESSRGELRQINAEMGQIRDAFSQPAAYRPYQSYIKDLLSLDRRIRQTLKTALGREGLQP
ncbi:MAG TPA: hypothetical protein PLB05_07460 [Candidatus Omnitrophota bacterium]|nr:hypothetical protein [Candidatus Omnitrophota bacterium]HPN56275.1 hypothetical protein [Candidatus Omnitrophota bacterium]